MSGKLRQQLVQTLLYRLLLNLLFYCLLYHILCTLDSFGKLIATSKEETKIRQRKNRVLHEGYYLQYWKYVAYFLHKNDSKAFLNLLTWLYILDATTAITAIMIYKIIKMPYSVATTLQNVFDSLFLEIITLPLTSVKLPVCIIIKS